MSLAEFSLKHSLLLNLVTLFILIAGILSLFNLRREAFPPIALNIVTVTTQFRGASASKVETLVTVPLEKELKEVENIDEMLSSSDDGTSRIILKIISDVKDLQKVINDIQRAVDRATDLPEDVTERPVVTEITMTKIPVISVSISGDVDEHVLRTHADELRDILVDISGVSSVARGGWRDEEFWVEPDINKMLNCHVSFSELAQSLSFQNVDMPGGKYDYEGKEYNVKVLSEFRTKENIKNTVIRSNDIGNWIRVRDIADVKETFSDDVTITKVSGFRSIVLTVLKRESGDIIKIVDNVREKIDEYQKRAPAGVKITAFNDLSFYVKRRLNVLTNNGIIAFILVVAVLFIFLPPAAAIVTALGIPVAFFITFMIMEYFGLSINLLTMFGLIIVLGIIVDDSIIIAENSFRYMEEGMSISDAVIKGVREVAAPVISTVITTIVAFSPLMFMKGIMGNFVLYIPLVIIIALAASMAEAFVILPLHLVELTRPAKRELKRTKDKIFLAIREKYSAILSYALDRRYFVLLSVIAVFMISLLLARFFVPFILFPTRSEESFMIRLEAESDISLEQTNKFISQVERLIEQLPEKYLDAYETIVGEIGEARGFDPAAKSGSNLAQISIFITAKYSKKGMVQKIINLLQPEIQRLSEVLKPEGVEKIYFHRIGSGPQVGAAIDARVAGDDFAVSKEIIEQLKVYISKINGIRDIADNYNLGAQEIQVVIDEEKAQKAYISNAQIAFAIRAAFAGVVSTTVKREKAEKEINVLIRLPEEVRSDPRVFDKIVMSNRFENLIPLKKVVRLVPDRRLRSIKHLDGKRFISVTADVDVKKITSLKATRLIRGKFKNVPFEYPGYNLSFSGEYKETVDSVLSMLKAFIVAIMLIYLILAAQFNSLVQPLVVMLTIPFGVIGVILSFIAHGEPLSFLSMIGFIGLSGVVVNDSIILVDFVNNRKKDKSLKEVIIEAGKLRFRPIILTTLTTVVGVATVAYGIGGGDPFLRPMALAISWGLLLATILTLIVIPCVYLISEDIINLTRIL